jgi:hypothetical protein
MSHDQFVDVSGPQVDARSSRLTKNPSVSLRILINSQIQELHTPYRSTFNTMTRFTSTILIAAIIGCSSAFTTNPSFKSHAASISASAAVDQASFADEDLSLPHVSELSIPSVSEVETQNIVVPENAVAAEKPVAAAKPIKKAVPGHKQDGLFAPAVMLAKKVLGDEQLNKVRGKAIGYHSTVIGKFVDTADSKIGDAALYALFTIADKNKNGAIDEEELQAALLALGLKHLSEKQIKGIFARADLDHNGDLDYAEWKKEAPKTLRTNLIKLAKANGGELGFLV